MKKCLIFTLVTAFLLTSCANDNIKTTMKDLESNNKLLLEQLEALQKENDTLKDENKDLSQQAKEKDLRIDRLTSEISLYQKGHFFHNEDIRKTKLLDVDLNNDDNKDFIKLECDDTKYYRLTINDVAITSIGVNVDYDFKVVDIDVGDNIKEIAISEWGPDKTPKTSFYRYTIHSVSHIGKINGHINDIERPGDGSLTTLSSGNILCSWFYKDKYQLSPRHMLVNQPKDLYEINHRAKVLKSIPILKSTTENEMIAALTVGEEVTLLSSDNKRWCQVEKENGVRGWFEVEGFDGIKGTGYKAKDVFEGLDIDNQ
ncbi:MAG: SH3 domain-containing protein [Maledivibacter sp.]|nr:SH3 domain-containing protein [Maledivibacter sp.]